MRDVARNVSIAVNVALILVVVACGGWIWRSQRLAEGAPGEQAGPSRTSQAYEAFIVGKLRALRLVGLQLPKVDMTSLRGNAISTDLGRRKGAIVLLFKPQSCQPCLITQLKGLQHIYETLEDTATMVVVGIGAAPARELKRFTRAFGLTYPIVSDTAGSLMASGLAESTPAVLLVNSYNTIVDSHFPSPGKPEFSLLYYNELRPKQRLGAGVVWERFDLGLGGVKMLDVIRNDFGTPSEAAMKLLY